jgi:predicted permease
MVALQQVLMLFSLILIGFFVRKKGIVSDNIIKEISSLVLNVTLPALIIVSMDFNFDKDMLIRSGKLVVISFVVYFIAFIVSTIFVKIVHSEGKERDVLQYACIFSNTGYMGYPVINAVLGPEGVFYTALYNLSFSILVYSLGVFLLNRSKDGEADRSIKDTVKSILNPALFAVIFGLILFIFSIDLPEQIFSVIKMIGGVTTPLSMMLVGFILSSVDFKEIISDKRLYYLGIVRLLILPLIVFSGAKLLGFTGFLLAIPVIITGMPSAANTAIIASRYDSDYRTASKAIFLTTFFSIFTIPGIITLVNMFM